MQTSRIHTTTSQPTRQTRVNHSRLWFSTQGQITSEVCTPDGKGFLAHVLCMSKEEIIENIYQDPAGHASTKVTYEDAKKKDGSITYGDVQAWFKNMLNRRDN